jgi:hypothetical protein
MAQYKWKDGARIKIPAQAAGERIEALGQNLGRGITARDVLAEAQKPTSPLHGAFEWDDSLAAERHRLMQAGHLLGCLIVVRIKVQHPAEDRPRIVTNVRVVHPVTEGDGVRRFVPTVKILSHAEQRAELLANALAELDTFKARYRQLRELSVVFEAVEEFRKAVRAAKKRPQRVRTLARAASA